MIRDGLHEYLDGLQSKMNDVDNRLREDFVVRSPQGTGQSQAQA